MEELSIRRNIVASILNIKSRQSLSDFKRRLVIQKRIYLLQAFGLYLGYRYNWYLYGPYSPELARDAFAMADNPPEKFMPISWATQDQNEKFERYQRFLKDKSEDRDFLEIVASIHFLRKVYPSMSKVDILQKVKDKQPNFTMSQCNTGWNLLEQEGLI